jgi:hypothetical protein
MPEYNVNETIRVWPNSSSLIAKAKKDYEYDGEGWGRWNEQAVNHPLPVEMGEYNVNDTIRVWPKTDDNLKESFLARGKKDYEFSN